MLIQYHTDELRKTISDFYILTGMSVGVTDTDFHLLVHCPDPLNSFCTMIQSSAEGEKRCQESDRKLLLQCRNTLTPQTHRCHAGLTDTAVPIIKDGIILGYILFGQVCESSKEPLPFSEIYPKIKDLGLEQEAAENTYRALRFFDRAQIESAAAIVNKLTKYIWLEHLIHPKEGVPFNLLIEHIHTHPADDLSVSTLCRKFHLPKNNLYEQFKKHHNCTVNEYVTNHRITLAQQLLQTTSLPIYEICEQVGIENYQYFCRRFKQKVGKTPLQFRKSNNIS